MVRFFAPTLTRLGVFMAHPAAFLVLLCYVGAWLVLNPQSFDWHAITTVATLLMTLFIQRAEHRYTQAIHAKFDELLRVEGRAQRWSEKVLAVLSLRKSQADPPAFEEQALRHLHDVIDPIELMMR